MEKISAEEINTLRGVALREKKKRDEIAQAIKIMTTYGTQVDEKLQIEIMQRGHPEEIMSLLKAFKAVEHIRNPRIEMTYQAQLYLYERIHLLTYRPLAEYMLRNMKLREELEQKYLAPDCTVEPNFSLVNRGYSNEGEIYMLSSRLQRFPKTNYSANMGADMFDHVERYLKKFMLSEKAETFFIKEYLTTKDDFISRRRELVSLYISNHKVLNLDAERELVNSNDHEMIMLYITTSSKGLQAEEELLARGNREEVIAYFDRLPTL